MKVLPFHTFCTDILHLHLTTGQKVLAKCVLGDIQPKQLVGEELELAKEMFGGADMLSPKARRVVILRLGRGSGKTTIAAAWAVYSAVTASLSRCGPGDVPVAITVAPDKATARLSVRMARELIRGNQALNRLVEESTEERIVLCRPDQRRVAIEAFAASRGGASFRGRTILTFLLDEAEFFRSDESGSYAINDRDIYGAAMPRLLPSGKGIFLSTPWPVETMMSQEFTKNFGNPQTCTAVMATTLQMRGDDQDIRDVIEQELIRDPDNAKREYFCEIDKTSGGGFFDGKRLTDCLSECQALRVDTWPCAAGADLAFKSDSSTLVVVQYDGKSYQVAKIVELRPRKGQPLKPSEVFEAFAEVCRDYRIQGVVADGHYREALKEHLAKYNVSIWDAPDGAKGKLDVYARTKAVLDEGLCKIPDSPDGQRLISQASTIVARPTVGGTLSIRSPRRIGMAHGDLVSAWTLAIHRLAYGQVGKSKEFQPPSGSPEWFEWSKSREAIVDAQREAKYLRKVSKEIKEKEAFERKLRLGLYRN